MSKMPNEEEVKREVWINYERRTTHANIMNTPLDFEADRKQLPCFGQVRCTLTILGKFDPLIYWKDQDVSGVPESCKGNTTTASTPGQGAIYLKSDSNS